MPGEAAWTQPNTNYPGFVNVSKSDTPGHLRVIVRTPHQSNVSALDVPLEAWDQLMADAAMVRQAVEAELGEHVQRGFTGKAPEPYPQPEPERDVRDDLKETLRDAVANGTGNGATADDPLGQRADTRSEAELDRDADAATDGKVRDAGGIGTDPDNGRPVAD